MTNKEDAVARYSVLHDSAKALFLIDVSHELTISGRHYYQAGDPHAQQALMGLNELQHHLSSEARHLIKADPKRYPDDVLIEILIEKADTYGVAAYLSRAMQRGFGWREHA